MPIVGFKCPVERTNVPFDHFDHCTARNGRAAYPPWLAHMIAEKVKSDVRHAKLDPTATRLTGCPREVYINVAMDYYVNPERRAAMDRGTACHETAANYNNPDVWYSEGRDSSRLTLVGNLFGVEGFSAKADCIRKDLTEIVDYKFPKDWSVQFRKGLNGRAKEEHAIQCNIIRLLLAQQPWAIEAGFDPERVMLTIWDHALGKVEGPEPLAAPYMTEAQILDHMPAGAEYTVREILDTLTWAREQHAKVAGVTDPRIRRIAASLPLVGVPMFNGQKCEQYCDVKALCDGLRKEFGEPDAIADAEEFVAGVVR